MCRDAVEIVHLPGGGGLLSYHRRDGSYLHTLNDSNGLARKLDQLKIRPADMPPP